MGVFCMKQYLSFLEQILAQGHAKTDRTGTGTLSVFAQQMRFELTTGFPLLTTKKLNWKAIVHELLWFLSGDTNIRYLQQNDVHIWDEWADENGDLGAVYGKQWRRWEAKTGQVIDQISQLMVSLKENPNARRHIVSAWNVGELEEMALPPCHLLFQFYVSSAVDSGKPKLSCQLTQRSADSFLGVPFNIASYALLTHMIADQLGYEVGEFIWSGGDCHIYHNHHDQVQQQLTRKPYALPTLKIKRTPDTIFDYQFEDFQLLNYQAHPHIKGKVAV